MLPALHLYRVTGSAHWGGLYCRSARALISSLHYNEDLGADIWTQNSYDRSARYLGPVHGFAGNAHVLFKGRDLLEESQWADLSSRMARTLERSAIKGEGGVNWPPVPRAERANAALLVQHCHGAPGMVTALSGLEERIDDLLLGGGELTWTAGPLAMGSNLCHGTAGNAFAFLKLFERTGSGMWLERARRFAMHAIRQSDAEARQLGRRRFSLWTGDVGLACFLWECIRGTARFPTVDVL